MNEFNEVEYMTDVVRLRYEIRRVMKRYHLLDFEASNENLVNRFANEVDDAPDFYHRIAKNGALAIRFIGNIPFAILTPYGAIPIFHGENYNFNTESVQHKFLQELQALFGLVETEPKPFLRTMAVTKLSWKVNANTNEPIKLPMPSAMYITPDADNHEQAHLYKILNVVNAKLIKSKRAKCILPGTEGNYYIGGKLCSLSTAIKHHRGFIKELEQELANDQIISDNQ